MKVQPTEFLRNMLTTNGQPVRHISISSYLSPQEGYYSAYYSRVGKYIYLTLAQDGEIHLLCYYPNSSRCIAHAQFLYMMFKILKIEKSVCTRVIDGKIYFYNKSSENVNFDYKEDLEKLYVMKTELPHRKKSGMKYNKNNKLTITNDAQSS